MNTNFQMLKELLEEYHPAQRGIAFAEELELIKSTLHIQEMNVLQLRNLRDFVVLFLGHKEDMESWDRMSAITSVIDHRIWQVGGNV